MFKAVVDVSICMSLKNSENIIVFMFKVDASLSENNRVAHMAPRSQWASFLINANSLTLDWALYCSTEQIVSIVIISISIYIIITLRDLLFWPIAFLIIVGACRYLVDGVEATSL